MSDKQHLMALGDYRFIIDKNTYESLQRAINYRWQKTDIINSRPNYQFSGTGEESITINGAVFNYKANQDGLDSPVTETGVDQISQIRAEAEKGIPLRIALDDGRFLGFWVLKSVQERQNNFIGSSPIKQSYNLSLAYFGDRV